MNLQAEIVSGESIGDIKLGENIDDVLGLLRSEGTTFLESTFQNAGKSFKKVRVANGELSFVADASDSIIRIWCSQGYRGRYRGVFYPGMSVREICDNSSKQLVIHGVVIVEDDFGVGFSVPDVYEGVQYDDVDSVAQLPPVMILDDLHVMDPEWWR